MNELEKKIRSTHIQPATKILIYSHPHTHKEYLFVLLAQQQNERNFWRSIRFSWDVNLNCGTFNNMHNVCTARAHFRTCLCSQTRVPRAMPHHTQPHHRTAHNILSKCKLNNLLCAHIYKYKTNRFGATHSKSTNESFKIIHTSSPPVNFSGSGSLGYQRRLGKRGSRALLWALTFPRRSKFMAHESLECEENFIGTWNEF